MTVPRLKYEAYITLLLRILSVFIVVAVVLKYRLSNLHLWEMYVIMFKTILWQ